jgi:hypothetical protein
MRTEDELRAALDAARRHSDHSRGWQEAIEWALGGAGPTAAPRIANAAYRSKTETQQPVFEVMKSAAGPITITDIMKAARLKGHDLLRPSVQRTLDMAIRRGLARRESRGRYVLLPDRGATS